MQAIRMLALIGLACVAANADILKLRDGRMYNGQFLGATRTEIWFQRDAPGDVLGAAAYPIAQVESLTFGPALRQSRRSTGSATGSCLAPRGAFKKAASKNSACTESPGSRSKTL